MRIALVSAPWNLLETPSLPLGILSAAAAGCQRPPEVQEFYANLDWADYLLDASGGDLTPADYGYVANLGVWYGMGDWVFTSALYDQPDWHRAEFTAHLERVGVPPGRSFEMAQHAERFVELTARRILASDPDVVGFSSTFQQNIASLALARRIKQLRPEVRTLMGGGNCAGSMGAAIHRNFDYVDYVISGEAEDSFVEFVDHLDGYREVSEVAGLSWRAEDGSTVVNKPAGAVRMESAPCPDYRAWFEAVNASAVRPFIQPKLLYEAARGCWWGEKHTCTFCGLNQLTIGFRSRPAEQVLAHLREMIERYRLLDVVAVDNILDMAYLKSLLPQLAAEDWDLHFYYEIKSNLREADVRLLRRAGLVQVQPGIENLSSRVLKIMEKGVHATQNVVLLRDCEENDITVDWNYLYGFPGESDEDYDEVLAQFPALAHLQPPAGSVRIILERFSPYFERPELGFGLRRPAAHYEHLYDLPPDELQEIAYQFVTDERGIGADKAAEVRAAVRQWRAAYPQSSLTLAPDEDGSLTLADRRTGWPQREVRLAAGCEAAAYTALLKPRRVEAVAAELGIAAADLEALVADWQRQGLVFREGGRVVALATRCTSIKSGEA
ncbi:RiPP maturation radical SAM C-methyltransferase [Kitasatospora viridis]|uniref:RiPP maturation radical SAM C-methyltransferase n=1 Tax=Kitasatospora viridis TaxID=281105 RepID=UPI0011A688DE|nr:RiPP maturation radical SAM C-methyltransferase [Kitasatospora viridis]